MGYNEEVNAIEGLTQEQKEKIISVHEADVTGLKNKTSELLGDVKKYKTQITAFETEGVDIDTFKQMKAKQEELENKKLLDEKNYNALLEKQNLKTEELQNTIVKLNTQKKNNVLTSELVKLGVKPDALEIVKSFFGSKAELNGDEVTIDGITISDSLKSWSESEQGQMFILAKQNNGAGSTGTPTEGQPLNSYQSKLNEARKKGASLNEKMAIIREAANNGVAIN